MNPESENQKSNNDYNNQYANNTGGGTQNVPNSVGALVLGILSIVFFWCYGIISIILGIIGLVLASQGEKIYNANPQLYTLASYKNLKAGKICAIIGLSLAALWIIALIVIFVTVGSLALSSIGRPY